MMVSKDKHRGLYGKYRITRTDNQHLVGRKHHGCRLFVLDLTHDKHAIPAIEAYIKSCRADYPALAEDLQTILENDTPPEQDHE